MSSYVPLVVEDKISQGNHGAGVLGLAGVKTLLRISCAQLLWPLSRQDDVQWEQQLFFWDDRV